MRREHDFPQPAGKDERAERQGDPPIQRYEGGETWVHSEIPAYVSFALREGPLGPNAPIATKEGRMKLWRIALALAIATSAADLVSAAPDGKIVIAQGTDPSTLDMTNHQEAPAANVGAQIFETLVERDQNLQPIPGLAAELPRAISPTLWESRLRNGIKFHNGEDFKAESVKFSIERLINPSNKLRSEEHTSELQSLAYLVCRLLLEKKN